MKSLELENQNVGAVMVGFTSHFSYKDILLASCLLDNPEIVFLQDAPDATFLASSDCGKRFAAPCKTYKFSKLKLLYSNFYFLWLCLTLD